VTTNAARAAKSFIQNAPPIPPPQMPQMPPMPPPPMPQMPQTETTQSAAQPSLLRWAGDSALWLGGKALGAAGRGVVSATWHPKTYAAALAGTAAYKAYKYKNRERNPENSYLKHYLRHAKKDWSSMNLGKTTRETAEAYGERIAKTAKVFKNMQGIGNDIGTGIGATLSGMKAMTGATRKGIETTARGVQSGIRGVQSGMQYLGKKAGAVRQGVETAARGVQSGIQAVSQAAKGFGKGMQDAQARHKTAWRNMQSRHEENAQKLLRNPAFVQMLMLAPGVQSKAQARQTAGILMANPAFAAEVNRRRRAAGTSSM
jgi:hypothetical protein